MARSSTSVRARLARRFWSSSSWRIWARRATGIFPSLSRPRARVSSAFSRASRSAVASLASDSAASTREAAARTASPTLRSETGASRRRRRRSQASASVARWRASPICDWLARAARAASSGSAPSRRTRSSATASAGGILSVTRRQRERMVGRTSSALGVHSSQTVWGGGSSMDLSRTLVVRSAMRSASSTRMTRQRPVQGRRWASPMRVLTSSMVMMSFSVVRRTTSGWDPAMTSRQGLHCPQPGTGPVHCRAAAKARAAFERPDPGGPVTSQAWVMASPTSDVAPEPAPPPRRLSAPRAASGARPASACASRCSATWRAAWAAAVKAATALS